MGMWSIRVALLIASVFASHDESSCSEFLELAEGQQTEAGAHASPTHAHSSKSVVEGPTPVTPSESASLDLKPASQVEFSGTSEGAGHSNASAVQGDDAAKTSSPERKYRLCAHAGTHDMSDELKGAVQKDDNASMAKTPMFGSPYCPKSHPFCCSRDEQRQIQLCTYDYPTCRPYEGDDARRTAGALAAAVADGTASGEVGTPENFESDGW